MGQFNILGLLRPKKEEILGRSRPKPDLKQIKVVSDRKELHVRVREKNYVQRY